MKKIILGAVATLAIGTTLLANPAASCVSCHGPDGTKNTMKPQAVPTNLTKAEFIESMEGYKAGTLNKYGMGALMKGFAARADAEAIANQWGLK